MKQEKLELLAPVGNWEVLEAVIDAGADAVYLGSKKHNMRMFRRDLNFTPEEINNAVKYAHAKGVKVYITVNNLLFNEEMEDLNSYLLFLKKIRPDALIVQDLGLIKYIKDLGINLPLHASVMMNIHNKPAINLLKELGVSRVILSREISLEETRDLYQATGMELEYFIHGDMCVCQSGQCYHSGMVFGESSNRGRCKKPCRWSFDLWDREKERTLNLSAGKNYLLAVKDMCMLPFIPEMADSGICSLKIEGRMRTADYLKKVVSVYRRALDRYYQNPSSYTINENDWQELYAQRIRDFSSMYAFKNPGSSSIGYSGEREPRFFSFAIREKEIKEEDIAGEIFEDGEERNIRIDNPVLSVRVGNIRGMLEAIKGGADRVYIGGETFMSCGGKWSQADLQYALGYCQDKGIEGVVTTPRITQGRQVDRVKELLYLAASWGPAGVMVGNLGTLQLARQLKGLDIYGDAYLNVINTNSVEQLKKLGVKQLTLQPEIYYKHSLELTKKASLPFEIIAHGPLTAMVMDHCVPAALLHGSSWWEVCNFPCREGKFSLMDEKGLEHPVEVDEDCRNHVFLAREVALLPFMKTFVQAGIAGFRLDLRTYNPEQIAFLTELYRKNLTLIGKNPKEYSFDLADWKKLKSLCRDVTFGWGGYLKGVKAKLAKGEKENSSEKSSKLIRLK
ncbi:MAG: U32 family peptidase [Candidatus Syntrophonatronum acetioxidans]|uniref:U32 family peptidase n=1 Tax=Candidatus Syntrophonatronum acetioxidans TaxID=1795816 RepID=A0A424YEH3_9FIRM|nr:MAG: U32 family peptidase [Candidatus Syntrophonatronum acetioxidans]